VRAITTGAKEAALLRLLTQNPTEKKLVFVHNRDSMTHLASQLTRRKITFAMFSGDMSGPRKDEAVEAFREQVPVLLCTESGGEGRNLQFCNTLINFDIPWNPMAIEQRIGRIDRIGQTREVFIFNLVTAGTIEDAVLRILDEKINMFELVVGEVGAILGEVDDQQQFPTLVLDAWLQETEQGRADAFTQIENQLLAARRDYEGVKQLDEALFGNELGAAGRIACAGADARFRGLAAAARGRSGRGDRTRWLGNSRAIAGAASPGDRRAFASGLRHHAPASGAAGRHRRQLVGPLCPPAGAARPLHAACPVCSGSDAERTRASG